WDPMGIPPAESANVVGEPITPLAVTVTVAVALTGAPAAGAVIAAVKFATSSAMVAAAVRLAPAGTDAGSVRVPLARDAVSRTTEVAARWRVRGATPTPSTARLNALGPPALPAVATTTVTTPATGPGGGAVKATCSGALDAGGAGATLVFATTTV